MEKMKIFRKNNFPMVTCLFIFSSGVNGHGYLKSPRSRNFVANQDGLWSGGTAETPAKESCPHCLNRKDSGGSCGKTGGSNYDYPLNAVGGAMPKNIQETYVQGQLIDLEATLTAHHMGHFEYKACAINEGDVATQECFDSNPLEFVADNLYEAKPDGNYPERAYIPLSGHPGYPRTGNKPHSHKYRLPENLVGDMVLIQWLYVTANSCLPEGYNEYDWPANFRPNGNQGSCGPLSQDGNGTPEQFWNCAEVKITSSGPVSPPVVTPTQPPIPIPTAAPVAPITPAPVPIASPVSTPSPVSLGEGVAGPDSRLIAYLGNWQSCPSIEQTKQYTHLLISFAVTYTWSQVKNNCDQSCTIGSPVAICNNQNNQGLVDSWRAAGKKVILSFGGAGMGGSWPGDNNDCWEYCYGKEEYVIEQLNNIVRAQNFDGVDIDYEYFYDTIEAQNFLRTVTTGLRSTLPEGSIVTHAPMDPDLLPTTEYYSILKSVASSLDFIMPQYYNGYTRPAIDGISGTGSGTVSALSHYNTLVDDMFEGHAEKVVFGFCISDCSGTGSNANADQAAAVMSDLRSEYSCNGGAFFWVAQNDNNGSWSKKVGQEILPYSGCSGWSPTTVSPTKAPEANPTKAPVSPPTKAPTKTPVSHPTKAPTKTPTKTPVSHPTNAPEPSPTKAPVQNPSEEFSCPSYTDSPDAVALPDCTGFYYCLHGEKFTEILPCPDGLLFNDNVENCDYPENVTC